MADVVLGLLFTCVQAYEYSHAAFGFSGHIYGATFFMATGFHGAHVIIGTIFLAVCLLRVYLGHFTPTQHLGFEFAAWYWHFVDVVWLFLFAAIYVWGAGGRRRRAAPTDASAAGDAYHEGRPRGRPFAFRRRAWPIDTRTPPSPCATGLAGRCPRCGEGKLFDGFLKLRPRCDACGLDFSFADSADGPAVFIMLIAGFVVLALALCVEITYEPPIWLHLRRSGCRWRVIVCLAPAAPDQGRSRSRCNTPTRPRKAGCEK